MTASPTWGGDTEEQFFHQMRGCRDAYRRLGDAIHSVLGTHDAVEFGCGVADQTERLIEHGWSVLACEHSDVARSMAAIPVEHCDLTRSNHMIAGPRAVAICTETAEHVPAEYEVEVVRNVAEAAFKFVVWSAAPPGQEWPGHVNLKPHAYWLGMFRMVGWIVDEERTAKLRQIMWDTDAQHRWCKDNFCVLVPA